VLIKRAGWMRYGFAVLVVAATVLLKLVLARTIEGETPFLLLFFAVLVSAWRGGAGPGLLATGLATLAASYFFIPPINSFSIENIGQAVRLIQFILKR
jgi:K+-sensing histidine kinase KdpD